MTLALSPAVGSGVPLLAAATTAPFPPTVWGMVQNWVGRDRAVPQFDLVMWSDGTDSVTVAKLWAGMLQVLTVGATALTSASSGTDQFLLVSHGFFTGDGPVQFTTSGTLPAGVLPLTNYWIVKIDADHFQIATTFANAMASTPVIVDLTSNGTGTQTATGATGCSRVHWHEVLDAVGKQIGRAGDGAVALTNQQAWKQRFLTSPMVVAYAVSATLSASTLSASVYPIQSR